VENYSSNNIYMESLDVVTFFQTGTLYIMSYLFAYGRNTLPCRRPVEQ